MIRLLSLVFILLFPTISIAYTAQTCILGPGDGAIDQPPVGSDNLSTTGQDRISTWKTFRWKANGSGDAYLFSIRMDTAYSDIDASSNDVSLAYAIYEDNPTGPVPGALKAWGYTTGVNFYTGENGNCGGVALRYCFDIQTVVTDRTIIAGNYYWIAFRSSLGVSGETSPEVSSTTYFERAGGTSEPYASWMEKCISADTFSHTDFSESPPTPSHWSTRCGGSIADNYYGWAIWTASDAGEPNSLAVSTSFVHGSNVIITGNEFGSKSPAAPLIWDDGEGKTTDSDSAVLAAGWDEVHPNISVADYAACRTRYRTVPYRSTPAPHSYSSQYLAGCHYQYADNNPQYIGDPSDDQEYRDVLITKAASEAKDDWYVSFYYRLDPAWNTSEVNYNNHKMTIINSGTTAWSTPIQYNAYCGTNGPETATGDTCRIEGHSSNNDLGDCTTVALNTANPLSQWIKWEETVQNEGKRHAYINKTHAFEDDDVIANKRSFTVGGYYRRVRNGGSIANTADYRGGVLDSNYRYFDDIYIDTTMSRVMLCNNATYSSATICEPQIPSAWSDTSVTVKANLGALTGNTAYLFVFDSTNTANTTGYSVTIGSSTSTITGLTITGGSIQ